MPRLHSASSPPPLKTARTMHTTSRTCPNDAHGHFQEVRPRVNSWELIGRRVVVPVDEVDENRRFDPGPLEPQKRCLRTQLDGPEPIEFKISAVDIWLRLTSGCGILSCMKQPSENNVVDLATEDPKKFAEALLDRSAETAPAIALWLERGLSTRPLQQFERLWEVSAAEAAGVFHVTRQAYAKWHSRGVPGNRRVDVSLIEDATRELLAHIPPERIPVVGAPPGRESGGPIVARPGEGPRPTKASRRGRYDV